MAALDKLSIDTPEQVALDFTLATVGSRFLALAIDTLIQFGVILAFLLLAGFLAGFLAALSAFTWSGISPWAFALFILTSFLVYYGYFAFFEALWTGQTPGKRTIGIRVMDATGRPISAQQAILRNVVRIADQLPGVYAVGILTMFLTERSQRLGDLAAGTVVVHERTIEAPAVDVELARPVVTSHGAQRLAAQEIAVVELFFRRRSELASYERGRAARQIADRIRQRLGIAPGTDDEELLEEVMAEYRASRRYR